MVSRLCDLQMQDVSEAVLIPTTEAVLAQEYREQGSQVICHQGRYWIKTKFRGFYQPIHLIARLKLEQITRPRLMCWAFRAALHEDDAASANGSIPVHLLSNLANYDLQSLSSNRRSQIKRCLKKVKIVQLTGPALLQEQGYEVLRSSLERTNFYMKLPSEEEYITTITAHTTDKHRIVIAGLIGDQLGGYCYGTAIDGTAYLEHIHMTTEALATYISGGLTFEFVQACRRSAEIREVVHSLHVPEDEGLVVYKEGIGFRVRQIPARVEMNPMIAEFLRRKYPHKYYRFTGRY